jgi:hypothetical protein
MRIEKNSFCVSASHQDHCELIKIKFEHKWSIIYLHLSIFFHQMKEKLFIRNYLKAIFQAVN